MQGIDYAYTLQGWLKGVNSTGATIPHDIGGDALTGGINQYVARDALGFNLNYFSGDYKSINPGVNPFPSYRLVGGSLPDSVYRPLYNGNISSMATHIRKFDELGHVPIFYNYRYDQLNRLVKQDAFFNFNVNTNSHSTDWGVDRTFHEEVSYDANGNIQNYIRHAIGRNGALMDDLAYKYYPGTNKLRQVTDQVGDNVYGSNSWDVIFDLDNQSDTSNYVYDEIGNLIQDKQENITGIKWNVYGKITEVNRLQTTQVPASKIRYYYDAQGNRIGKTVNTYHAQRNRNYTAYTWYVRDAQGNLMSTYYTDDLETPGVKIDTLVLSQSEVYIYGSSRLGVLARGSNAVDNDFNTGPWINPYYAGDNYNRGYRQYELTNHLGNVLTVISDRNKGVSSGGSLTLPNGATIPSVSYYDPEMLAANDYYAFGMLNRTYQTSDKYRFGFNGKETDNEVKGRQNQQDYGMRIYDPRVGRFLSVDPITQEYPELTPYQFASNRVIDGVDLDGLEYRHVRPSLRGLRYITPAEEMARNTGIMTREGQRIENERLERETFRRETRLGIRQVMGRLRTAVSQYQSNTLTSAQNTFGGQNQGIIVQNRKNGSDFEKEVFKALLSNPDYKGVVRQVTFSVENAAGTVKVRIRADNVGVRHDGTLDLVEAKFSIYEITQNNVTRTLTLNQKEFFSLYLNGDIASIKFIGGPAKAAQIGYLSGTELSGKINVINVVVPAPAPANAVGNSSNGANASGTNGTNTNATTNSVNANSPTTATNSQKP